MGRCWRKGVLIRTLMLWTFIGLCCAGHRPFSRQERPPHSRHHDRATQRLQYPSLHELGAQRVEFPSKCAPGFYREGDRPYLGRCVPCECNGLTNECEDWTGRCLNCQYNTAGDRCERCKEGYYGNAAQRTCILCPCPFSTSANRWQCEFLTKAVLTGILLTYGYHLFLILCLFICHSHSCAPGYYGDPLTPGGSCQPCNCNGNSNNCDPKTGVCKNTLEPGDTNTDEQCQECDNCALTLLRDLEKLDDELEAIKNQLDNVSASATFKDRLENSTISNKIIKKIIGKEKHKFSVNFLSLFAVCSQLYQIFARLSTSYRVLLDLLEQLRNQDGRGDAFPNESLTNMLNEAQRMVTEMQNRNFTSQKTAAETERDENNMSDLCDQNEAAADKIRTLLKDYGGKLEELEEALKEARDLVKQANVQNGLNAKTLENLLFFFFFLNLARIHFMRHDYEQLAAQLDGAKNDLTEKVKDITEAAAKTDIVEAAEEHAKNLTKLAKELEDAVKNASGRSEVRDAKDAIQAYKNILDAINAAEAAANEARDAADAALNVSCRLNNLYVNYANLFLQKQMASFIHYNLFFPLLCLLNPVKNLWKTIPTLNDKISAVENLNSQFSPINNISESIRTLKELIAHARDAANKIAVPMKFNGNSHVELHPPKNLDDLRAYTAMSLLLQRPKGRGDGARRRRQLPPGQFVLYLGNRDSSKNYIGLVLRNDVLYGVYKLNGVEYEIKSDYISRSDSEPAMFDKVDLRRIYQDAEIVLTKEVSSRNPKDPLMNFVQGQEGKDLLDVSPSDIVFYVGGYPANFTPPSSMNYSKYKGCIEFSSFNDKVLSLYNFKTEENTNDWTDIQLILTTVGLVRISVGSLSEKGNKPAYDFKIFNELYVGGIPQELRDRYVVVITPLIGCLKNFKFQDLSTLIDEPLGISRGCPTDSLVRANTYLTALLTARFMFQMMFPPFLLSRPHFSLDVRTRSPEGLLFFAATRGGQSHLALYMSKGRIRLSVAKQKEIFNREKYNDGKWHSVSGCKFRLVVDGLKAQDGQLTSAELKSMQQFMSPVYLGGVPLKTLPKQGVSGCIRKFKMNGAQMSNPTANFGAGPCFEGQTQRGAYFSGDGAHVFILYKKALKSIVNINQIGWSRENVHLVDHLHFSPAGTLMHQTLPVRSSFVGCIQDMKINDMSVSFDRSSAVFGPVNLKECPG
uniref:Si:ch211-241e1.3 n=1 Tax=Kryptolebias marmoratus TaxID=37003 RepID=A0A3Q3ANB8_KRYMA